MGIQAPTMSDYINAMITGLISFNKPLILLGVFIASFLVFYLISKKRFLMSLIFSFVVTVAIAAYFAIGFANRLVY
jgi:hypothetical protein